MPQLEFLLGLRQVGIQIVEGMQGFRIRSNDIEVADHSRGDVDMKSGIISLEVHHRQTTRWSEDKGEFLSTWINKGELIILTAIISSSCMQRCGFLLLSTLPRAEQSNLSIGNAVCEGANSQRAAKRISCVPFYPTLTLWFGHAVLEVSHSDVIGNGFKFSHEVVNARGNGASASSVEDWGCL